MNSIVFDVIPQHFWVHYIVDRGGEKIVEQCLDGGFEVATKVLPLSSIIVLLISCFWRSHWFALRVTATTDGIFLCCRRDDLDGMGGSSIDSILT